MQREMSAPADTTPPQRLNPPPQRLAPDRGRAQALGGRAADHRRAGGIVGLQLAENKALATLPVSLLNVGVAAAAVIPAAWLMRAHGRRIGYIVGCLAGVAAGIIAASGTAGRAFWLFCLGRSWPASTWPFVQSYRFAAADSAPADGKARAISMVMIGGLVSAIIGPQAVIWTRDLTPAYPFAASFLALGLLALLAIPVVSLLNAPPPARQDTGGRAVRFPRSCASRASSPPSWPASSPTGSWPS